MTYIRTEFQLTPSAEWACEYLAALLEEQGYEGFEYTAGGLIGYVLEELYNEETLQQVTAAFPDDSIRIAFTSAPLSDINWNTTWEEAGFEPITIDESCIVIDERHPISPEQRALFPMHITVLATQSFGTGTHATTQLMLRQLLKTELHDRMVIDCGCGTGILAIAAALKGANPVIAFDIDHWSTECAPHNAEINHADIDIRLGDIEVVNGIHHSADVVLANINRNVLLADMPHYARLCKEGGTVLLSGILTEDAPVVCEKAKDAGLTLTEQHSNDEWILLKMTKAIKPRS